MESAVPCTALDWIHPLKDTVPQKKSSGVPGGNLIKILVRSWLRFLQDLARFLQDLVRFLQESYKILQES